MKAPTGTVTFLFTDIEGSTRMAQKYPETMPAALKKHNSILSESVKSNNGIVFRIVGDAFCCAFENAEDAVKTAYESQVKLSSEKWDEQEIKIRIGIHTGAAEWNGADYSGYITLARTHRVMSVAHGGQVLLSKDVVNEIKNPESIKPDFRDMGERRLKDLIRPEHLYQLIDDVLPSEFPPLKTTDARQNNLPLQSTSFIGRSQELKKLKSILSKTKLLTLTGMGGTGKTRLALKIGESVLDEFANGVWFVDLSKLHDETLVDDEVFRVLNLSNENNETPLDVIINFFRDKQSLLILDNCEHLIDACARMANELLRECPDLKIIASSREPLHITAESVYLVPPMGMPVQTDSSPEKINGYEAVILFCERAKSVKHDFELNAENARTVGDLCRRLDGIPLAIELAAARIKVLTPGSILEKINDRFSLLTSGSRTGSPRQQTLRALIDWSYDLLSDKEKLLFQRLSVFSGGWTLDAAENVCSDKDLKKDNVLEILSNLVDKSLVTSAEEAGSIRYDLPESIREYSIEKFSSKKKFQNKHFNYFLKLCRHKSNETAAQQLEKYRAIKADSENLRTALNFGLENKPQDAMMLANMIDEAWEFNGNIREGFETYKRIFEKDLQTDKETMALALMNSGYLAAHLGEYEIAQTQLYKSLELRREIGDKEKLPVILNQIGNFHFIKDEIDVSRKFHEEALKLSEEINDKLLTALSSVNLAPIIRFYGDIDTSYKLFKDALKIFRELKDKLSTARALTQLASAESVLGNLDKARSYFEESISIFKEYGDHIPLSVTLLNLGNLSLREKKFDEAGLLLEECLSIAKEFGYTGVFIYALIKSGSLALLQGHTAKAGDLFLQALKLCHKESDKHKLALTFKGLAKYYFAVEKYETSSVIFGIVSAMNKSSGFSLSKEKSETEDTIRSLKNALGEERFESLLKSGEEMDLKEAMESIIGDL